MFVERYPARPFERWIHGLNGGGLWLYDPKKKTLWRGKLAGHQVYVEESSWYSEDGGEMYAEGFYRWSKRWKELTLWGPYDVDRIRIRVGSRKAWRAAPYNWPETRLAHFVVDD